MGRLSSFYHAESNDMNVISIIQNEVKQKLLENIPVEKINFDSKTFSRFGQKDHCWGIGHEWVFNHKQYWVYNFGSWKTGEKFEMQSWEGQQTEGFYKKLKSEMVLVETALEIETTAKHKNCADTWLPIYESARQDFSHAYLEIKKIGRFNSRLSKDQLLIPIYDELGFVGVQRIWPDGTKRFSSGIKIKGSFSPLKDFKEKERAFLCEGFATAATIQEAFPDVPVIVAFSCHNIPEAVHTLRFLNPNLKIVIAADADESGQGEKWAKIAQKKYPNVTYILPKFEVSTKELSDFNDLAFLYGREQVKDQLTISESAFSEISCLGYNGETYFYTSSNNQQIVDLNFRNHDEKGFLRIIPDLKYWQKKHGFVDENGKSKINWSEARSELMMECVANGIFDSGKTRGVGVWRDGEHIVINDGARNNAPKDSEFIYLAARKRNLDLVKYEGNPLSELWAKGFSIIGSKNKQSRVYIAAWLVQAYIFPLLKWRFNIWLRGPAGLGKTDFLRNLKSMIILSDFSINATAFGIVSEHKSNQVAFLFDEAEPENSKYMADFLSLARQCSTNGGGSILRGSPSGNSVKYNPQVLFALGSIQDSVVNAADKSRWLFVDIQKVDHDKWKAIERCFASFSRRKNEILSYIIDHFPMIEAMIELAKSKLIKLGQEARIADQLSAVIGCMAPYLMTKEEAAEGNSMDQIVEHLINEYQLLESDYTEDNKTKESELALESLAGLVLDQKGLRTVHDMIYGELCLAFDHNHDRRDVYPTSDCSQMLSAIGVRVFPGQSLIGRHELFIAAKNDLRNKMLPKYPKLAQMLKDGKYVSRQVDVQAVSKGAGVSKGIRIYYDIT